MATITSEITQTGSTLLGGGLAVYLIIWLLDRALGSEKFYKGRIEELLKERDEARVERDNYKSKFQAEEKARIKCQSEARTLKRHMKK